MLRARTDRAPSARPTRRSSARGRAGVHPDHGLTTGELDDAVTKRSLAARSADTFVLASAEKIGAVSRFPVLGLDEVTGIVVDPEDANPLIAQLPTT